MLKGWERATEKERGRAELKLMGILNNLSPGKFRWLERIVEREAWGIEGFESMGRGRRGEGVVIPYTLKEVLP